MNELPFPKFPAKSSCIVYASSKAGKTRFLINLIKDNAKFFEHPPDLVLWNYGVWDEELRSLESLPNTKVIFYKGIPPIASVNDLPGKYKVIIFDDLFSQINMSVVDYFTIHNNHMSSGAGASCWLSTQDLSHPSPCLKLCRRNCDIFIFLKTPQDQTSLEMMSRKIYRNAEFLPACFNDAKKLSRYPHLIVDLHSDTDERLQVRSDIFNKNGITIYKTPQSDDDDYRHSFSKKSKK